MDLGSLAPFPISPYTGLVDRGTEIRLFDPRRKPGDWTDIIRSTQCAVFLKDRETARARTLDGKPFSNPDHATCLIFDGIGDAQQFCQAQVQAFPHLRCEIYDSEGLAHPPLAVFVHPDHQDAEESGSVWSRRRKLIAILLFLISPPLIWMDVRRHLGLVLPTFLAANCIFTGLRFLYWDAGLKDLEKERKKRLEEHLRKEQARA